MNCSPFLAQERQNAGQLRLDAGELAPVEAEVLAQARRAIGAMQVEHRLAAPPNDVHVSWSMIIRIDDDAQPIDGVDGRHLAVL